MGLPALLGCRYYHYPLAISIIRGLVSRMRAYKQPRAFPSVGIFFRWSSIMQLPLMQPLDPPSIGLLVSLTYINLFRSGRASFGERIRRRDVTRHDAISATFSSAVARWLCSKLASIQIEFELESRREGPRSQRERGFANQSIRAQAIFHRSSIPRLCPREILFIPGAKSIDRISWRRTRVRRGDAMENRDTDGRGDSLSLVALESIHETGGNFTAIRLWTRTSRELDLAN